MAAATRRLRFGIMCTGTTFPAWQARCLEALLTEGAQPALLIVEPSRSSQPGGLRRKLRLLLRGEGWLWAAYDRLRVRGRAAALEAVDLSSRLAGVPARRCEVVRKGRFSEYFSAEDVAAIRRCDLDFILRFAYGIIRGDVLSAARHGVWSFHHGDVDRYRGGPPCFWEVYHGDPITGAVLQRLTERLDGGVVLQRGFFKTVPHSFVRNRDAAFFASAGWPARVCRDIRRGAAGYLEGLPSPTTAPIFKRPTNWQVARFLGRVARTYLRSQVGSLLRADQWNIGVVDRPVESLLGHEGPLEARWLPPPPRAVYLADPFALPREGGTVVLAEEYDYRTGKGRICSFELPARGRPTPRPAIERATHLSYPYLFTHAGETYCIPESCTAGEVVLYRAERVPDRWVPVATLIEGFPAADATVVRHGDRWWLFCTSNADLPGTTLHVWHAPDLLGPWTPHAGNPVKTDVRSSRPAGTPFVHEGRLYRPAQDGSRTYGGAVTLNLVRQLTPAAFEETPVARLEPDPRGPYPAGLHTIAAAGRTVLVDGKRRVFVPVVFRGELAAKAARLLARAGRRRVGLETSPTGA